jgi:hypothetical protein
MATKNRIAEACIPATLSWINAARQGAKLLHHGRWAPFFPLVAA